MLLTADTLTMMFKLIQKDYFFEEVLHKFLSNKNERDEFRQELHLTICEMPKAITYWNEGIFKWVYISIVKKNVCSSNSRWHYKHRKKQYELYESLPGFQIEDLDWNDETEVQIQQMRKDKVEMINSAIAKSIKKEPVLIRDFSLFNKYYNEGMTYRQISKDTGIPLMSVHIYVKNARELVKKQIETNKIN